MCLFSGGLIIIILFFSFFFGGGGGGGSLSEFYGISALNLLTSIFGCR